jgi:hypothetical protein
MVALFSQEQLPVSGEILVARIPGHDAVEVCQQPILFRTQNAP